MSPHPAEKAIRRFWRAREQVGSAASRGGHLVQGIIDALADGLVTVGIDRSAIRLAQRVALPGMYRSTTIWDLLVLDEGIPVGAINVATQIGPSFGNNFNNRVSEMVAAAADFNRAYAHDAVRALKPCLGFLFVLEECEASTRPTSASARISFPSADSDFTELSIRDRYREVFRRLLSDHMYDAVCYITSRRPPGFSLEEPDADMGFTHFIHNVADRIAEIRKVKHSAGIGSVEFGRMLAQRDDVNLVMSGLTSTPAGLSAAEAAVIRQRRKIVTVLRQLALEKGVNEAEMHKTIGKQYWLFGGQYTGVAQRRHLPLDEYDIPLICADGSLQIVELKGPGSKLVQRYRSHLIVANEVHEAVSQCLNYLRSLDEMGATLRTMYHNELGLEFDYRRARATVVIGHPDRHALPNATREQIDQTIRSYNAALSRVHVLTWADLLETADRALSFDASN